MPVITMSRQIGSGAQEIANRLCEALGLRVFEKSLIRLVADDLGLSTADLVDYSEDRYRRATFLDALFRRTRRVEEVLSTVGAEGREGGVVATRVLDEDLAIDLTRSAIEAAHEHGDVLIIGRGSQVILEEKRNVLHVRLVAPPEKRIRRLCARSKMTPSQARRLITQRDRATEEYLRRFYNADVDDPTLYHAVLNTGKLGIARCVRVIKALADRLHPETSSP